MAGFDDQRFATPAALLLALLAPTIACADDGPLAIVRARCLDCHSGDDVQGGIDLAALTATP